MALARVRQEGALFLDAGGGQVVLRGVNLGGDCKVPWPNGGTERPSDFSDHRDVSFIGRPFPLAEADEHLGRIAGWGFNSLRLLTTWEAVEHRGPGLYDIDYLDFLEEVCRRAGEHGLYLFIDFHEDVWSRMSGGDGAPGWTFEAVGLDVSKFDAADAAHVFQARYDYADPRPRQPAYPQMSWGSNHRLPATGVMWTLFWGGRRFTPDFRIDGENVQDFLQGRYLGCLDAVAARIADMPHVLGFDSLNEPGLGWLGQPLSYRHLAASKINSAPPRVGPALSPLDAMAMAQGVPVSAVVLTRASDGTAQPGGERRLNPNGVRIWRDGSDCPFERAGVYRMSGAGAVALKERAFCEWDGRDLDIAEDIFAPLFGAVAGTIRRRQEAWSLFAEMDAFAHAAGRRLPASMPERSVNASHWYDTSILYLKRVPDSAGEAADRYRRQLAHVANQMAREAGPALIGEFGIPFDLDDGAAFERWSDGAGDEVFAPHAAALSDMYDAFDALGLHSTQWNYTASNRNDPRIGDHWNQEDLSIFSRDQQRHPSDPDSGGRALAGFCRPYAPRIQGRLGGVRFDRPTRTFRLEFEADSAVAGDTLVFVPPVQFPSGVVVRFEGVPAEIVMPEGDRWLRVRALESGPAWLTLESPAGPAGG